MYNHIMYPEENWKYLVNSGVDYYSAFVNTQALLLSLGKNGNKLI